MHQMQLRNFFIKKDHMLLDEGELHFLSDKAKKQAHERKKCSYKKQFFCLIFFILCRFSEFLLIILVFQSCVSTNLLLHINSTDFH